MAEENIEIKKERVLLAGVHTGCRDVLSDTTEESMKELCELALKLSFASENSEEFSQILTEHTARWSSTVPELPVSRGRVYDVYSVRVSGYEATETRPFSVAVLEAWIGE